MVGLLGGTEALVVPVGEHLDLGEVDSDQVGASLRGVDASLKVKGT